MATSGSIDFNLTRNDIINAALRLLGQLAEGETATDEQLAEGAQALNMMVKHWESQDIHLWKHKEATIFVQYNTAKYTLGASNWNATQSYTKTEISTAGSSGDSTIDVDSITGVSDGDYIGVELDDSTMQWTTVNGSPSGTTITLTDVLTDDISVDANVYAYTSKINRPLKITSARLKMDDSNEIMMTQLARDDYSTISRKESLGNPTQYFYNKNIDLTGDLYLWVTPNDVKQVINITYIGSIEDFDAVSDNPDFPREWLRVLTFNLASDLSFEYGLPLQQQAAIEAKAVQYLNEVLAYDQEEPSVQFMPTGDGFNGFYY